MDKYDRIQSCIEIVKEEIGLYDNFCSTKLQNIVCQMGELLKDENQAINDIVADELIQYIKKEQVYSSVYLYSFIVTITSRIEYFEQFIEYVLQTDGLKMYSLYFLMKQFRRYMFINKAFETTKTKALTWLLFDRVYIEFEQSFNRKLERISKDKRNKNLIVVLTDQILSEEHGPTKTTLERCRSIIEDQGKQVFLINTNDLFPTKGNVPYYKRTYSYKDKSLGDREEICWKGTRIPYYQCIEDGMSLEEMHMIIDTIENLKPYRVLIVGGGNLMGGFVDKLIPTVTIGLYPSDLDVVMTSFQTLSCPVSEENERLLQLVGRTRKHVVLSLFTSGFKEQQRIVNRQQLGIPEDKFVMATVGGRLDSELDDAFFELLCKVLDEKSVFACCGKFSRKEEVLKKYPTLNGKFYCLGFQEDMLAVLETIDLYVNPDRKGGGTSSVEALYKGVPVVALEYGDVACNIGDGFSVSSYSQMIERIERYKNDRIFYGEKVREAKERAAILMDTTAHLKKLIEQMESLEEEI